MPPLMPIAGKKYAVLGLARSGLAVTRWLLTHGADVVALDDSQERLDRAKVLGASTQLDWTTITALIQSPGVPLTHAVSQEARDRKIPIMGDIDLYLSVYPNCRYIGVTGTNGKSTTTALIAHILNSSGQKCLAAGNIGVPIFDVSADSIDAIVLELSSYQLELSLGLQLECAAWINLSEDHLARHGTMTNYCAAKKKIYTQAKNCIIGIDDKYSQEVHKEIGGVPVSVGVLQEKGLSVLDGILFENGQRLFDLTQLERLQGEHNWQNAAVAYGVGRAYGIASDLVLDALKTFPGLAHRQELVATIHGIRFINDSKATNAVAADKALKIVAPIYWILGGQDKSDGIESLAPYFPQVRHAFLIGDAASRFANTLTHYGVKHRLSGTLSQAVKQAYAQAQHDQLESPVVLLSPACASFDQFKDFEDRGEFFRSCVEKLKESGC